MCRKIDYDCMDSQFPKKPTSKGYYGTDEGPEATFQGWDVRTKVGREATKAHSINPNMTNVGPNASMSGQPDNHKTQNYPGYIPGQHQNHSTKTSRSNRIAHQYSFHRGIPCIIFLRCQRITIQEIARDI